ncbi:two-component system sensor histidine kinase NtrB [Rhodopirellula sp. MGV]|uniref:two-component system sensor histidine kinase NtrB n=1 Tax=Rhodopirellula sp. MGV TaxID=2023130 RepID=UPI000B9697F9|nr:PAS domain S-box protein [Rhodopirellula sp. MGV]OYP28873.1 hypothetical protein CGZ80_25195 [Rhodopirellula sp. MGV]PNY37012.1 PAS domain S-box protein [Rhodopirellula baltica]
MTTDLPTESAGRLAQLEAILNNAVDAIITIDRKGTVQSVNPATETLFGYRADEIVGQNVSLLMPEPDRSQHDGYLQRHERTGEKRIIGIGREVDGRRKDGTVFPAHLAVSEYNVGADRFYTGVVRDITDLRQAQLELSKLNKELEQRVELRSQELQRTQSELVRKEKFVAMGRVSGGIAHEIRNPLNVLKSSAYFLLNAEHVSEEKRREHLHRIERQVGVIDGIVTALSESSLLRSSSRVATDIAAMVRDVLASEFTSLESIGFEVQHHGEPAVAMVDQEQLRIVVRNIVRNACDAMADGGTVQVATRSQDGIVCITIADQGEGIAAERIQQITEPFYSTKSRGMGLGLSICKSILDKNEGVLNFESELGRGTEVRIQLQAAEQE